jgi:hypothetical protein
MGENVGVVLVELSTLSWVVLLIKKLRGVPKYALD